jgi:flagellar basal-body rod modification protein FlgD
MQISEIPSYSTYSTTAAQSNSEAGDAAGTAGAAASSIDANQFMTLLMAQLTHQNPLEPLKDSEMLSQFAQLNSVQELTSIRTLMTQAASANQTGYAASLIGKSIRAGMSDGNTLQGVVSGITMEAGKVYVHVGNKQALLSDVVEIKA